MPGRIESPSTQLGQLLLRGYTMLAAACDDCQIPLMRDPQTLQSHCVSCRRLFDSEGTLLDNPETVSVPPGSSPDASMQAAAQQPQLTHQNISLNNSISPAAWLSLQPPAGTVAANGPVASSSNSQQLPSVQQQQRTLDLQQHEAADSDEEREVAEIRARLEQQRLQEAFESHRRERAAAAAGNGTDDPSQMLADQLLAGWTMLAESCPMCYTPLMRSRALEVRCIVCNLPVVIQQQSQQPGQSAVSDDAAGSGSEQTSTAAGPAVVYDGEGLGYENTSSQQQHKEERGSTMQEARNEGQVPIASGIPFDEEQVLRQLQQVLLGRLQETTQQLTAMSSPQAAQLTGYLATAEQLLHCLEKVKQVMSL